MMAVLKRINYVCFLITCFRKLTEVELFTLTSAVSLWGTLFFSGVSTALSTSVMVSGRDSWVVLQCNLFLLVLLLSQYCPHLF